MNTPFWVFSRNRLGKIQKNIKTQGYNNFSGYNMTLDIAVYFFNRNYLLKIEKLYVLKYM